MAAKRNATGRNLEKKLTQSEVTGKANEIGWSDWEKK
jgi:hypothetical protein